jgi:hypothetical protein
LDAPVSAVIGAPDKTATTRRADARKEKQRRMARRARCWRVHSDVTQEVNFIEGKKRCAHAVLRR